MLAELYGVTTDFLLGREGGTVAEDSKSYADNLDAMGCKLAYHEIMQRLSGHPRKTAEFRKLLETFRNANP